VILEKTETVDDFDRVAKTEVGQAPTQYTLGELGHCFHLLLFFPPETLKGGLSATLARRAILIDMATSKSEDPPSYSIVATRTSCRLFVSRYVHDAKSSFVDYVSVVIPKCLGV